MVEPFVIEKGELGAKHNGHYDEWKDIIEGLEWWLGVEVPWEDLPVGTKIVMSVVEPKGESVL